MQYIIENKNYQYFVGEYRALTDTPHIHTHLEMIYLTKGSALAAVDGKWFSMKEGDLFLASSNQIHYYDQLGDVTIFLIIFDDAMDPLLQEFLKGKKPINPVIPATSLPKDMQNQLRTIARKRESDSAQEKLEAKGRILTLLSTVLSLFSYEEDTAASHDSVKNVLQYCLEHYLEPISLDSIAQDLHLSKFYISHIFHQRMEIGFSEFIGRLRVKYACELLLKEHSIIETAFSSGFSSVRTFNRVFLKEMGISPRDYILRESSKKNI